MVKEFMGYLLKDFSHQNISIIFAMMQNKIFRRPSSAIQALLIISLRLEIIITITWGPTMG